MTTGGALAEGFYWYAEKLMWGYKGVDRNPEEALRLYRQAADLGFSDAFIRIGQIYEHGKGAPQSVNEAVLSYHSALEAGNFLAFAFMAKLLSRTALRDMAEGFWRRFFLALKTDPTPSFVAEAPGALIHAYIANWLHAGAEPRHLDVMMQHRQAIIAHHQHLLEYTTSDAQLDRMAMIEKWMEAHL